MMKPVLLYLSMLYLSMLYLFFSGSKVIAQKSTIGFIDAAAFGFLPTETGVNNTQALQAAIDKGGTINISRPGNYKLAGTVYIGDNTSLYFGNGVVIEKAAEKGAYCQVILNKGALSRTYNSHITISGLNLKVNGVEKCV